jgi:hypothetical protein
MKGPGGNASIAKEIRRPTPPRKIMPQRTRNSRVCRSILGIIHSIDMPKSNHTPLEKRGLLRACRHGVNP